MKRLIINVVLYCILGLNTGVPFTGSLCTAAVTGCPGGCRHLCDSADIVKDSMKGKYHLFR